MNFLRLTNVRWLRAIITGASVVAFSLLVVMVIVAVYAFGLAIQARGSPDQHSINQFAAAFSARWLQWIEILMVFVIGVLQAPKAKGSEVMQGLLIGLFAGVFGLALSLAFGAHFGLSKILLIIYGVVAGFVGGLARKTP